MKKGDRLQIRNTGETVIFEKFYTAPSGMLYADVIREKDKQLMAVPHFDLVAVGTPVHTINDLDGPAEMYM